jgi:membrane protein
MKNITLEFTQRYIEDDVSAWAAKLTFYILLAMFPFLMFIMQILSHTTFNNPQIIEQYTGLFPDEVLAMFQLIIIDLKSAQSSSIIPITILGTIWASSKGIMAIFGGLNKAYRRKETRSYFYLRGMAFVYTIAFAFILLITFAMIIFGNKLIDLAISYIHISSNIESWANIVRLLFSMILSFLFFIMLYNITPNKRISFKEVIPGSIFATIGWIATSYFFSIYINFSSSLSYMYGSLTGIIVLMLWLYICSTIIIIGGEINAMYRERKIPTN